MPLPQPVPAGPTAAPATVPAGAAAVHARRARRAGRRVLLLVLVAALLGAATAFLGHDAGLIALTLATVALGAAGVLGLRAQWLTVVSEEARADAAARLARPMADRTAELRGLRDRYVAAVDTALDAGDLPRARELADAYSDDALRVLTH